MLEGPQAQVLEKDGCVAVFDRVERTILAESVTVGGIDPTKLATIMFASAITYSLGKTPGEIRDALADCE